MPAKMSESVKHSRCSTMGGKDQTATAFIRLRLNRSVAALAPSQKLSPVMATRMVAKRVMADRNSAIRFSMQLTMAMSAADKKRAQRARATAPPRA